VLRAFSLERGEAQGQRRNIRTHFVRNSRYMKTHAVLTGEKSHSFKKNAFFTDSLVTDPYQMVSGTAEG